MCGRYVIDTDDEEHFFENFGAELSQELFPRGVVSYNLAPTQSIPVIRLDSETSIRHASPMHWGLIPSWAKDRSMASKMINARAETVAEKPSYRQAFRRRRCVVPASGWYEWRQPERTPFYFKRRDGEPLLFAGLWEEWTDAASGEIIESCTILTRAASEEFAVFHHRMPFALNDKASQRWLEEEPQAASFEKLSQAAEAISFAGHEVSRAVGRVANNRPDLIKEVKPSGLFD